MSQRLAILAYIAAVLLISGFVKANEPVIKQGALVNAASINQSTGILEVRGVLSTPCESKPKVQLDSVNEEAGIISLFVSTQSTTGICIQVLGPRYEVFYDLKELSLKPGRTYSLQIKRFVGSQEEALVYTASEPDRSLAPFKKTELLNFQGKLVQLVNIENKGFSGFALQNRQNEFIPMVAPQMNLEKFEGQSVWVSGYAVHMAQNDPLESQSPALVIVPTSISAIK